MASLSLEDLYEIRIQLGNQFRANILENFDVSIRERDRLLALGGCDEQLLALGEQYAANRYKIMDAHYDARTKNDEDIRAAESAIAAQAEAARSSAAAALAPAIQGKPP